MNYRFETIAIRTQTERSNFLEHSTPLYITSSFIFEDAEEMRASFAEEKERNIYSRFSNPNTSEFIDKICQMEGAEDGVTFSSTIIISSRSLDLPIVYSLNTFLNGI